MKMMLVSKIIKSVLMSLYSNLGVSLVMAFLYMFLYRENKKKHIVEIFKEWRNEFIRSGDFRVNFFFALYVALILTRTLLCREIWSNPVSNVIGIWSMYDADGNLYTENIENFLLFLPFTILSLWKRKGSPFKEKGLSIRTVLLDATLLAFAFSSGIEFAQLFFKLGTWQLSDMFFNTLGGACGGLVFLVLMKTINGMRGQTTHGKKR